MKVNYFQSMTASNTVHFSDVDLSFFGHWDFYMYLNIKKASNETCFLVLLIILFLYSGNSSLLFSWYLLYTQSDNFCVECATSCDCFYEY